jgi:hypothetical protein
MLEGIEPAAAIRPRWGIWQFRPPIISRFRQLPYTLVRRRDPALPLKEGTMTKITSTSALAVVLLVFGLAAAQAASKVTFVSGKGADSGDCASPAAPCRTFQFAAGQTIPFGEVKALDPAGYGRVTITQSISITGVEGVSINAALPGDDITINAGPNDVVNISHLTIDGVKTAQRGIVLNSGGSLNVDHCAIRNFTDSGILLQPMGKTKFRIADTAVTNNNVAGIFIATTGGAAKGTIDHAAMDNNGTVGLGVFNGTDVTSVESTANDNVGSGFGVNFGAVLRLGNSAATRNGACGVANSGSVFSAGNNFLNGNVFRDVCGIPLSLAATQ